MEHQYTDIYTSNDMRFPLDLETETTGVLHGFSNSVLGLLDKGDLTKEPLERLNPEMEEIEAALLR